MKRISLLALLMPICCLLGAQPWMPVHSTGPVKYADVLARYHAMQPAVPDDDDDEQEAEPGSTVHKEGKNHLFEKWNWYWSQHLDSNGYMVPPAKTLMAWQAYQAEGGAGARTAAAVSNWVFEGPQFSNGGYSGIGRINMVTFDPVDSNTFYVGSAAGSTWKTTDGGNTWAPLYNNLPTLGVADIKINPRNPSTIYVATGDGDHGDTYSSGIIISHNGGATWLTSGLNWLPTYYYSARSLLINPLDTSFLVLGTSIGIYKSYNNGANWALVSPGNYKQILYKPGDTSVLYGSMYTDTSAQIMLSVDAGNTWNAVTTFSDAQRISLAVCPANPSLVKAVASNNSSGLKGVYSSIDNGATYTPTFLEDDSCNSEILGYDLGLPTHNCGGQGWYDLCIAINPANANEVTVGGVNTYFSQDGGASWQIANQWYGGLTGVQTVHADKHCLAYNNLTGALFETCDGGVYKNYGPLTEAWTDLTNGICITEFYRNAVNNDVTFCIGGAQDNGTKLVDGGIATDLTGGDGMQPLINYGDPANIWYCAFQNGSVTMTRDAGLNYHSITDTIHSSGGWVTPYSLHPTDTATLIIGMKQVFATHNSGLSWEPISPVFDSDQFINRMAISSKNPNYIYVEYYDYNVWEPVIKYTANFGASWDTVAIPFTTYISDLQIDPRNETHFWVTLSGYTSSLVYSCNLTTHTWVNESAGLPVIPAECMVIDTSSLTRYVGTDVAIFYRDTTMNHWALYNTGLPSVQTACLNINYTTGELWAATFGRGMWKSLKADLPSAVPALTAILPAISITPNPTHGSFVISATGTELRNSPVSVKLLAADGRTTMQTNGVFDNNSKLKANAAGLPPGFYICEVSNKNGVSRSRVVIY